LKSCCQGNLDFVGCSTSRWVCWIVYVAWQQSVNLSCSEISTLLGYYTAYGSDSVDSKCYKWSLSIRCCAPAHQLLGLTEQYSENLSIFKVWDIILAFRIIDCKTVLLVQLAAGTEFIMWLQIFVEKQSYSGRSKF